MISAASPRASVTCSPSPGAWCRRFQRRWNRWCCCRRVRYLCRLTTLPNTGCLSNVGSPPTTLSVYHTASISIPVGCCSFVSGKREEANFSTGFSSMEISHLDAGLRFKIGGCSRWGDCRPDTHSTLAFEFLLDRFAGNRLSARGFGSLLPTSIYQVVVADDFEPRYYVDTIRAG